MKSILITLLICACAARAASPQTERPIISVLAQGESITLTDGRVFTDWKIKRHSGDSVFIQSTAGITKVDKRLLPAEVADKFPYDQAAVAAEAAIQAQMASSPEALRLAAIKKAKHDREIAEAFTEARRNQKYIAAKEEENARYIKNAEEAAKIYAMRKDAHEAELAKSFDGLIVDSVTRDPRGLVVEIRNVAENTRVVHRTDLVGLSSKGEIIEAGDVRGLGADTTVLLNGGAKRIFLFVIKDWDCVSLQWKDRPDLATTPLPKPAIVRRH